MLNILIISLFMFFLLSLGFLSSFKIKSINSYYLSDRKGTVFPVSGSLISTIIGGSATLGVAGMAYQKGFVAAWWLISGSVGLLVLAFFFSDRARSYAVYTLPGILGKQYGGGTVKIASSLLIVIAWSGIIAAQIIAVKKIICILWPADSSMLTVIITVTFVVYTIMGGQFSVIRTDFLQSIILIAGIVFTALTAAGVSGYDFLNNPGLPDGYLSFPLSGEFGFGTLLFFVFFVGSTYLAGPDIYSRIFCSSNDRDARRSLVISAIVIFLLSLCIVYIGIVSRTLYPGIPPESAFPEIIIRLLPDGWNGLIVAALLAAVISSADTCLLTSAAILTEDIIKPVFFPGMDGKQEILLTRVLIAFTGSVSMLLAFSLGGIVPALMLAYTVYSGGLVVPLLMGFFRERLGLNSFGAVITVFSGGGLSLYLKLSGMDEYSVLVFPLSAFILLFASRIYSRFNAKY